MHFKIVPFPLSLPAVGRDFPPVYTGGNCENLVDFLKVKLTKNVKVPLWLCPSWVFNSDLSRLSLQKLNYSSGFPILSWVPLKFLSFCFGKLWSSVSPCWYLQFGEEQFAMYPYFTYRYKCHCWFFILFRFWLVIRMQWWPPSSLHWKKLKTE